MLGNTSSSHWISACSGLLGKRFCFKPFDFYILCDPEESSANILVRLWIEISATNSFSCAETFDRYKFWIIYSKGGEAIYYHGPHEFCITAGGLRKSVTFILKFSVHTNMRKSDISYLTKYLFIMEFHFNTILYSNLWNGTPDLPRLPFELPTDEVIKANCSLSPP